MANVAKKEEMNVVEFNMTALAPEELEAYHEEMDGLNAPMFRRVKTPSGGSTVFEVPTDNPEEFDPAKDITGVILHHHPLNRYYKNPVGEGGEKGQAPDCMSHDGKRGMTLEGEALDCASCPLNQYGSSPTGGKACQNRHAIYILEEGQFVPTLIEAPPTSLKPLTMYIHSLLLGKRVRSFGCVTKISVKKERNDAGKDFSMLQFAHVGNLPSKAVVDAQALGAQVRDHIKATAGRRAEPRVVDAEIVEASEEETKAAEETFKH